MNGAGPEAGMEGRLPDCVVGCIALMARIAFIDFVNNDPRLLSVGNDGSCECFCLKPAVSMLMLAAEIKSYNVFIVIYLHSPTISLDEPI